MSQELNRKSLMLDTESYDRISVLSKKGGVARPVVVDAMLALIDEAALLRKIGELRAAQAVSAAEDRKKRAAVNNLLKDMDMTQVEAMLAAIQRQQGLPALD